MTSLLPDLRDLWSYLTSSPTVIFAGLLALVIILILFHGAAPLFRRRR